jgi:hypothetical protein
VRKTLTKDIVHVQVCKYAKKSLTSGETTIYKYTPNTLPPQTHGGSMMTHKYRGCIIVLSINTNPTRSTKVLTSGFDQGFTVNTSKRVFRGIW